MSKDYIVRESVSFDADAWKYAVLTGLILVLAIGFLQITPFGIVYGSLLKEIGSEAQDTSTVDSIFTMMLLGAGLPANQFLQKVPYRTVALIGATCFCIGSFLSAFVQSTTQLVFTFSVLQGCGWGLTIASAHIAFADYFSIRERSFYISVAHLLTSLISISFPWLSALSVNHFGYRKTILLIAAVNLHMMFAALCFHPVKWHLKDKAKDINVQRKDIEEFPLERSPKSSSMTLNFCHRIYETFDLALFKDPVYVNAAIGVSLALSSDTMYISFLPLLLENAGFSNDSIPVLMTIYVVSDLIGKISLCILTACIKVRSRYLIFIGATCMAVLRLGQTFANTFEVIAVICSLLGLVRCLVENTTSIVFVEMYPNRYITSSCLCMVVNAIVIGLLGQLIRTLITVTRNNGVILLVLSASASGCAIPWAIELGVEYIKKKANK